MKLLNLIKDKYSTISLVGMAKNCGKTTALNQIIMEAMDKNLVLGITSIGRDGEKQDIVTYTEKPLIYIGKGTIIATAEETFKLSEAKLELIDITDINTAIGRVIIGRALSSGYVQIAGPSTNSQVKLISEKMLNLGAKMVIVDGAIDRISSASPRVAQGTILATGAVLSRDMNKVIELTAHQVALFNLKEIQDKKLRQIAVEAINENKISIIDEEYNIIPLNLKTSLNSGYEIARNLNKGSKYIIIGGSLVSKTIKDVVAHTKLYKNITFIIEDASKIFIDHRDWQYFERIGIKINVIYRINLLAITVNPYSPKGYYFEPSRFVDNMKKIVSPIPAIDVMMGE